MLAEEYVDACDDARRLAALKEQMRELDERLTAAITDMVYARRRAQDDCRHADLYGIADLARAILPFRDALETALAIDTQDVQAMRAGLELAHRQLVAVLERCRTSN
jgi:molecular chaperone GrpE